MKTVKMMTVKGVEIGADLLDKMLSRMRGVPFSAGELQAIAEDGGIHNRDGLAMRVADRLIQRERKCGNIKFSGRLWSWIGG